MSPSHRATGVYFWNFQKRTYIFEIFFKYKKEKTAPGQTKKKAGHGPQAQKAGVELRKRRGRQGQEPIALTLCAGRVWFELKKVSRKLFALLTINLEY